MGYAFFRMTNLQAIYLVFCFFAFTRGGQPQKVPVKCNFLTDDLPEILCRLSGFRELDFDQKATFRDYQLLIRDNSSFILTKKLRQAVQLSATDLTEKKYRWIAELEKLIQLGGAPTAVEKELLQKLIHAWDLNPAFVNNYLKNHRLPFPNKKFHALTTDP